MKINLVYNDFQRIVELDESKKIGSILENMLITCSLMIYNIEHCKIIINNAEYVLGSDIMPFNIKFSDFITDKEFDENSNENKIILYDRKRDELGNVIKNNYIIERYNKWFINNENEIYFNNFINQPPVQETNPNNILFQNILNRNIISRNILSEVINIQNRSIRRRLYPNNEIDITETGTNETETNETETGEIEEDENIIENTIENTIENISENTIENTVNESNNNLNNLSFSWNSLAGDSIISFNWDNNMEQTYYNLINHTSQQENNQHNNEEDLEEENEEEYEEYEEIQDTQENISINQNENLNILNNEVSHNNNSIESEEKTEEEVTRESSNLNRVINIFDRYIRNYSTSNINNIDNNILTMNNFMQFSNLMTDEYEDMPPLISLDDFEFQQSITNRFIDVKVVLTEEEFNTLETNEYNHFNSSKICDCLICMNEFKSDDIVLRTCNEHIFHKDCIKSWLCKESNKCPICRNDIGNSKTTI